MNLVRKTNSLLSLYAEMQLGRTCLVGSIARGRKRGKAMTSGADKEVEV